MMIDLGIPFDEIDRFFFEEALPELHPALREMATDVRLLHLKSEEAHIKTLSGSFRHHYLFIPWWIDDLFDVSYDDLLVVGQASTSLFIAYLLLDQLVDGQIPAIMQLSPLIQEHFFVVVHEKFHRLFGGSQQFWPAYYRYLREFFNGLTAEAESLFTHNVPYDYQTMQDACRGKSAPLQIPAYALACLSGQEGDFASLSTILDNLLFADQLNDDCHDWEKDFKADRYAYPIFCALEAENDQWADAGNIPVEDYRERIDRHKIQIKIADEAEQVYQESRELAASTGWEGKKIDKILAERIGFVVDGKARVNARIFFTILAKLRDPSFIDQ